MGRSKKKDSSSNKKKSPGDKSKVPFGGKEWYKSKTGKRPGRKLSPITDIKEDISPQVVDKEAYADYRRLQEHALMNEERLYYTSDPNTVIDLASFKVKSEITHLPEKEQKDILARYSAVRALISKMGNLKRKAFGQVNGRFIEEDNSLLAPRKTEVLELFGRFYTLEEVHKLVNKEWGIEVSKVAVSDFKVRHLDKIQELQEKYKRDYSHVRLGYKRSRLDELSYLYQKRKELYEEQPTSENHKLLLQTLEAVRKETEGEELKVSFEGEMNVNHKIEMHIHQDIMSKLSIKNIVLSRLCAKYGVDQQLMLHRLNKSYYAKHVGTQRAENDDLVNQQVQYPSQHIYDFNKIEKLNKQIQYEEAQIVEDQEQEMQSDKREQMSILKQAIVEKLRKKKDQTNGAANKLSPE